MAMANLNKPWYKRWWGALVIIILALILFLMTASAFYFISEIKNAKQSNRAELKLTGQKYEAAGNNGYWLGSAKAKITIVEFGDFACPVCLQAFPTIREISSKYKSDIKFIWRDYPVVSDYSILLALAGRCAGEQGFFWLMHDKLFQNQGVSSAGELSALANQTGADLTKFNDCLNQQKYLTAVQKDLIDGQNFGIAGTPTYFVNGYKLTGDVPYDIFVKIIEQLKK